MICPMTCPCHEPIYEMLDHNALTQETRTPNMIMLPPHQTGLVENGTGGGCSSCPLKTAGFLEGGGGGGFFLPATIVAAADSPPDTPVLSC